MPLSEQSYSQHNSDPWHVGGRVALCGGGGGQIADFGLSDFYPPGATRRSQCGSFSYLAPEVRQALQPPMTTISDTARPRGL